ncbi:MAG TPA: DUF3185 domain-containing protein [Chthoniobacterales bacterium]|nr:DUF3185 domain-containing protein [Chthoniobacterales bacterium]
MRESTRRGKVGTFTNIAPVKPAGIVGIVLIIVGIIGFAYGGITWSQEKKDAQFGPLEIKHTEDQGIKFPPIVSGICLVGGILLVALSARKT